MSDKEDIKQWLNALANDDYVEADKQFINVVNSSLKSVINNKKPAIIKQLSADAEQVATNSVNSTSEGKKE